MPGSEGELMMEQAAERWQQSAGAMGTTFTVVLYGSQQGEMEAAAAAALDEAARLERILSRYLPDSEVSRINRAAGGAAVRVEDELFELLSSCREFSRTTDGAFDITAAPLSQAWGFFESEGREPDAEALKRARRCAGYAGLQLDGGQRTVRLARAGMAIDLGGVGKGYAVDRMSEVVRRRGFDTALIVGSGSSIRGLGAPPGESGWQAEIRDSETAGRTIAQCRLREQALVTSGTAERGFWSGGRRYSHLIDPRTGQAVGESRQVSVLSATATAGEVWAKACLINGRQWARENRPEELRVLFAGEPMEWV